MEKCNINGIEYSVPENPYDIHTELGRFVLIEQHTTGTFDKEEIENMAERGFLVLSVAFGQNLYQFIEDDEV